MSEPNKPCKQCHSGPKKKAAHVITELVFLAGVVGFVPELLVSGLVDVAGPCGWSPDVCLQVQIQGVIKLVALLLCSVAAVVIALIISKEFD